MAVATYSLITLEDYKSHEGIGATEIEADAFSLYCSASDASNATVKKSGNTLTLVITGGVAAGTHAIDLTNASYDTLSKLVTYINTLTGWVANLEGWASAPSTDLKNMAEAHVLGIDDEFTLIFYENYILERLIDRASVIIESFLRRNIKSRNYVNERYDAKGYQIFLKNYPVTAIIQVCNGAEDVIRVKCNSTTARHAYVEVDATAQTVKMIKDGVTDATHDLSAITTMTALATAMNAVSGWEAAVMDSKFNAWLTSDLFSHPSRFCLEEYTELQVPNEPLTGLNVDMEAGIIEVPFALVGGDLNVFVSYTAGYSSVPFDLVDDCCKIASYLDSLRERDMTLIDERDGDYSWRAVDLEKALTPEKMNTLKKYQRPLV